MTDRWRRAWRVGRFAAGGLLLLLVLTTTDVGAIAAAIGGADLWLVAPALAGLIAVHVVPALAWRFMVEQLASGALPRWVAIRAYYAAQALGGITPANIGGDVYRAGILRGAGFGWRAVAMPIVVQRATSYVALAVIGLIAMGVVTASGVALPFVVAGTASAIAIGLAAAALLAPPPALRRLIARFGPSRPVTDGTALTPAGGRTALLIGLTSGLLFHAVAIVLTWLVLVGTDGALATPAILATVAVARLSLAVPLSPSAIGVQEGVLAALVGAAGGPVAAAVAGMLLARIGLIGTTVIGIGLMAAGTVDAGTSSSPATESARG